MLLLRFDLLANARAQLIDALEFAEFLRELVVQFGNLLPLDPFNLHLVLQSLPGKAFILSILWISNRERPLFARFGAAQVLAEFLHRIAAANIDENIVHVDRLSTCRLGFLARVDWIACRID